MTEVTTYSPSNGFLKPSILIFPPALSFGSPCMTPSASKEPPASESSVLWASSRASASEPTTRSAISSSEAPNVLAALRAVFATSATDVGSETETLIVFLVFGS